MESMSHHCAKCARCGAVLVPQGAGYVPRVKCYKRGTVVTHLMPGKRPMCFEYDEVATEIFNDSPASSAAPQPPSGELRADYAAAKTEARQA